MKLTTKKIESIIEDEIIVDCYSDDEVNMGWAIFMEENINYPFQAYYLIKKRDGTKVLKAVEVVQNHTSESNFRGGNYYVDVEYSDLIITVNISDLQNINADEDTLKAVEIWNYRNKY